MRGASTDSGPMTRTRPDATHATNRRLNADDEAKMSKMYTHTINLLNLIKMIVLIVASTLFTIGLVYLTVSRHYYSFTQFSVDLMAGVFVALGSFMLITSFLSLWILRADRNQVALLFYAFVLFLFFILLLVLGVVGLTMNSTGELSNQIRIDMLDTARRYEDRQRFDEHPRSGPRPARTDFVNQKMDWLQRRFYCCGIDTYADWKSILKPHFSGYNNNPIRYVDTYQQENSRHQVTCCEYCMCVCKVAVFVMLIFFFKLIDDVPDSCCINPTYNCGKTVSALGRDRSVVINIRGCLPLYSRQFSNDIEFTCGFSIGLSFAVLLVCILLLVAYNLVRRNRLYLHRFAHGYLYDQIEEALDSEKN